MWVRRDSGLFVPAGLQREDADPPIARRAVLSLALIVAGVVFICIGALQADLSVVPSIPQPTLDHPYIRFQVPLTTAKNSYPPFRRCSTDVVVKIEESWKRQGVGLDLGGWSVRISQVIEAAPDSNFPEKVSLTLVGSVAPNWPLSDGRRKPRPQEIRLPFDDSYRKTFFLAVPKDRSGFSPA